MSDESTPAPAPAPDELIGAISVAEFCRRFDLSKTTYYERLRRGDPMPREVKLGNGCVRLLLRDIADWQDTLPTNDKSEG